MVKDILLFFKKETFLILLYFIAFIINILFLILAYKLGFSQIDNYIIIITVTSLISALFYSLAIKSKKIKEKIILKIKPEGLKSIIFFFLALLIFLHNNEDIFFSLFFISSVISEFLLNLAFTKHQINGRSYQHAFVRIFQGLIKLITLLLIVYTNNIIKIGFLYNFIIIIFFSSVIKDFNFKIDKKKKNFGNFDVLYTLTGASLFQLDKIISTIYQDVNVIIKYFIIFKISSIFQILGNIISQPIRNLLIEKKLINVDIEKKINVIFYLLLSFLAFSNLILLIINSFELISFLKIVIVAEDIMIYNLFSLAFILHTRSSFYLDRLYLNNQSLYLTKVNIICIIIICLAIYLFNNPIVWSLSIFISQILLAIFSKKMTKVFR